MQNASNHQSMHSLHTKFVSCLISSTTTIHTTKNNKINLENSSFTILFTQHTKYNELSEEIKQKRTEKKLE